MSMAIEQKRSRVPVVFKCFFFMASSSTTSPFSAAGAGADLTSAGEEAFVDTAEIMEVFSAF